MSSICTANDERHLPPLPKSMPPQLESDREREKERCSNPKLEKDRSGGEEGEEEKEKVKVEPMMELYWGALCVSESRRQSNNGGERISVEGKIAVALPGIAARQGTRTLREIPTADQALNPLVQVKLPTAGYITKSPNLRRLVPPSPSSLSPPLLLLLLLLMFFAFDFLALSLSLSQ